MTELRSIVFLTGRPGSGKGTLGNALAQAFSWRHLSVGELLRGRPFVTDQVLGLGHSCDQQLGEPGKLVSSALSVGVLVQALAAEPLCSGFFVDGFPRSRENWEYWIQMCSEKFCLKAIIDLDCTDETALGRCLARVDNRVDDDLATIQRRLETFHVVTEPIVSELQASQLVCKVDGMLNPWQVFYNAAEQLVTKALLPSPQMTQQHVIFLEGNIGSGKSSLLQTVVERPLVEVFFEDVTSWQSVGGQNLLHLLYKQPEKWAFPFQSAVQLSCSQVIDYPQWGSMRICERSIFSAFHCFAHVQNAKGLLAPSEFAILKGQYELMVGRLRRRNCHIVYLQTLPEIAFQCMMARGRSEEGAVTLDYIKTIHDAHEACFTPQQSFGQSMTVHILDGNRSFDAVSQNFARMIEEIQQM